MSKIEGKYATQWLKVQRFGSVRTCSPEIFWSPNLNLNSNRTLHSVRKVWVQTEVLDRTSATLEGKRKESDNVEILIVNVGSRGKEGFRRPLPNSHPNSASPNLSS